MNESIPTTETGPYPDLKEKFDEWIAVHGDRYPHGVTITIDATPSAEINISIKEKELEEN